MPCHRSSANGAPDAVNSDSERRPSSRTRSTTRASRVDVDRMRVPLAEMRTAGVIIALSSSIAGGGFTGSIIRPGGPREARELLSPSHWRRQSSVGGVMAELVHEREIALSAPDGTVYD